MRSMVGFRTEKTLIEIYEELIKFVPFTFPVI